MCNIREFFIIFFFKQKTAYEMRISDWSSDVCSSDLTVEANWLQIRGNTMMRRAITLAALIMFAAPASARPAACTTIDGAVIVADDGTYLGKEIGRASGRERVCPYV